VFERFRLELNRYKQRPFLEAVAAACALVATADGEVSFSERARLDSVIESLSQLRLFDPHEVVDAFDEHVARLAEVDDGMASMLDAVVAGTRAEGAADLLLRISAVMSRADGRESADEHEAMLHICRAIKLPDTAVDEAYAAVQA
jgi:tellurite resistance protein TerB